MTTKVLIVADGFYRFENAPSAGFSFVELVRVLESAGMIITKAHRDSDSTPGVIQSFRFDAPTDLSVFDVIWMFGAHGKVNASAPDSGSRNLDPDEILAIETYMNNGGGIFATGDHLGIGSDMCGRVPRLRLMRAWYGPGDTGAPAWLQAMPTFPRNFTQVGVGRADTLRRNPIGTYPADDVVWFENQSDSQPQPLAPTTFPAHPILRHVGRELVVYADHMHEGKPIGAADLTGIIDFSTAIPLDDGSGRSVVDFPLSSGGNRELPRVIVQGQTVEPPQRLGSANSGGITDVPANPTTVNILCVYDGLVAGVGRVVTASTFHHYVDINLSGDPGLTAVGAGRAGADAASGQGFAYSPGASSTYADIKQVFVNITNWLARSRPTMSLILERSTISQDEATANPDLNAAILVTIDGVRPSQFPNGGITSLGTPAQLATWAPSVTAGSGLAITPTRVDSDDPTLSDRIQRFTFTYRLNVNQPVAFSFAGDTSEVQVNASASPGGLGLNDFAVIQLVKSANPFMLDLAGGNDTHWLSSDLRVFPVVTGRTVFGQTLPLNATRAQAHSFLSSLLSTMTIAQFESLATEQAASALSPIERTTNTNRRVYNFAIARVRQNGTVTVANDVRVFFRIFTSQTTAALTFNRNGMGEPSGGYRQTSGPAPISMPSPDGSGTEWLSIPMFASTRNSTPANQTDPENIKIIGPASGTEISRFFGALIDNNLPDAALPERPNASRIVSIPELRMGEHQCLVAQVVFAGTPIPSGAQPWTSDKLSQRNIALSSVANPGRSESRRAIHTFEIEATPHNISEAQPPDEIGLTWLSSVQTDIRVEIYISTWNAQSVVDLAERFYARHEIEVVDEHTISIPGGGTRYVPIPRSAARQVGILSVAFPLGIKKGQRFDLSIRQITNRSRNTQIPDVETKQISIEEALDLLKRQDLLKDGGRKELPMGIFDLGNGLSLVTDLRALDEFGDYAVLMQAPDPKEVADARARAGRWRELVGAFQLGVPVSTREDMLDYHLRLLSLMLWRLERLDRRSRWQATMIRYVDLLSEKVRALGGRPEVVPATPDGIFDVKEAGGSPRQDAPQEGDGDNGEPIPNPNDGPGASFFEPAEDWLREPGPKDSYLWSGKVSGLLFDHFGKFEGFTIENTLGKHARFFSRETAMFELARNAWLERDMVTVITVSKTDRTVIRFLLRGYR